MSIPLLCFGNIELCFEIAPGSFGINCPWFMLNPCEPGAILKCKLPLVPAGLFQGLNQGPLFKMQIQFIFTFSNFILNISLDFNQIQKSSKIGIGMLKFTPMDIKLQMCLYSISTFVRFHLIFILFLFRKSCEILVHGYFEKRGNQPVAKKSCQV